jgi:thiamine biosynthesis lipoprotein
MAQLSFLLLKQEVKLEYYTYSFSLMGCPASFQFYAPSRDRALEVKTAVLDLLTYYDQYYTNYSKTSFTAQINRQAGSSEGIIVDDETASLLDYAQSCYELSEGLFDITSGPLHKIWLYEAEEPSIPTDRQIAQVLTHVGWDKLIWERPRLTLPIPHMNIDFGGVVKEYAVDAGARLAHQMDIHHGVLELGGDLAVLGPRPDGQPWNVAIAAVEEHAQNLCVLPVLHGAVATSGSYARSMVINGVRYCHILNPKTGYPVQGVASITVLANLCLVAGSMTTIAFLKGRQGLAWLQNQDVPFVFVDSDLKVTNTIL